MGSSRPCRSQHYADTEYLQVPNQWKTATNRER